MKILNTTLVLSFLSVLAISCSDGTEEQINSNTPQIEDVNAPTEDTQPEESSRISYDWAEAVNADWESNECLIFSRDGANYSLNSQISLNFDPYADTELPEISLVINEHKGDNCEAERKISVHEAKQTGLYSINYYEDEKRIEFKPTFNDVKFNEVASLSSDSRSNMLFGMNIFHDKIVQNNEIALKGVQYEYFLKFSYKKKDMDPEAKSYNEIMKNFLLCKKRRSDSVECALAPDQTIITPNLEENLKYKIQYTTRCIVSNGPGISRLEIQQGNHKQDILYGMTKWTDLDVFEGKEDIKIVDLNPALTGFAAYEGDCYLRFRYKTQYR